MFGSFSILRLTASRRRLREPGRSRLRLAVKRCAGVFRDGSVAPIALASGVPSKPIAVHKAVRAIVVAEPDDDERIVDPMPFGTLENFVATPSAAMIHDEERPR